jgi:hypothetical protein
MATRRRLLGEGTLGDRRPDPAISRVRLGHIDVVDGWHVHGTKTHHHEEGNEVHKHGAANTDLGLDSDGTLVIDPRSA